MTSRERFYKHLVLEYIFDSFADGWFWYSTNAKITVFGDEDEDAYTIVEVYGMDDGIQRAMSYDSYEMVFNQWSDAFYDCLDNVLYENSDGYYDGTFEFIDLLNLARYGALPSGFRDKIIGILQREE